MIRKPYAYHPASDRRLWSFRLMPTAPGLLDPQPSFCCVLSQNSCSASSIQRPDLTAANQLRRGGPGRPSPSLLSSSPTRIACLCIFALLTSQWQYAASLLFQHVRQARLRAAVSSYGWRRTPGPGHQAALAHEIDTTVEPVEMLTARKAP
ncbi:hypothetical protein BDW75DRAFT_68860 [Aspergillus navahoensis]